MCSTVYDDLQAQGRRSFIPGFVFSTTGYEGAGDDDDEVPPLKKKTPEEEDDGNDLKRQSQDNRRRKFSPGKNSDQRLGERLARRGGTGQPIDGY